MDLAITGKPVSIMPFGLSGSAKFHRAGIGNCLHLLYSIHRGLCNINLPATTVCQPSLQLLSSALAHAVFLAGPYRHHWFEYSLGTWAQFFITQLPQLNLPSPY